MHATPPVILIVDDEPDIHTVTQLGLHYFAPVSPVWQRARPPVFCSAHQSRRRSPNHEV